MHIERKAFMRNKVTFGILIACAVLFVIARTSATRHIGGGISHFASATSPDGTVVKGEGCLEAGVEGGCLILTTTDKKNKYSLHFDADNKPNAETMIQFEGTTVDVDTCMQGTPVKVTKWTALKTKCPAESK
jgi:hypothetical protein